MEFDFVTSIQFFPPNRKTETENRMILRDTKLITQYSVFVLRYLITKGSRFHLEVLPQSGRFD